MLQLVRCFIQDLSLNVHYYLDLFLHRRSSSSDNHWWYQQHSHELLAKNLHLSFDVSIKSTVPTEFVAEIDWKNVENDRKSFGTVLKIRQKNKYMCRGCNDFSKVFLHFKKIANSPRNVLQTYSEICLSCVIQHIYFQKQSVEGAIKMLGKSLKTVLDEVYFVVHLIQDAGAKRPNKIALKLFLLLVLTLLTLNSSKLLNLNQDHP